MFLWRTNFLPKALEKHWICSLGEGSYWPLAFLPPQHPAPCFNSQESLTQRSSPLPQYCLPLVRRLALTGLSSLGLRMTLKICFPVHSVTGWRRKGSQGLVSTTLYANKARLSGDHMQTQQQHRDIHPDRHTYTYVHTHMAPAQTFSIVGGGRRTLIFSSLPTNIEAMIWQALARSKKVSLRVRR